MKCIILANNSNNNYGDYQSVLFEKEGSSLFKKTIISNIPYCEQFIIICNDSFSDEIHRQMNEIRDVNYKVIVSGKNNYDEKIRQAIMNLDDDEVVLIIPCEMRFDGVQYLCSDVMNYKDYVINARKCAMSDKMTVLLYKSMPTGIYCFQKKNYKSLSCDASACADAEMMEIILNNKPILSVDNAGKECCVKLKPAFKDYLWGGVKLREKYGKQCDLDIIAESWELSAHEDGESRIAQGKYQDKSFTEYLKIIGKDSLGWKCGDINKFPILIKFIDAKNPLSIQVHPDDDYALMYEDEYGKNEMWYILDCEEGAGIYCGFKQDTSAEEVRERIKNNTILDILNWIPVKKGDVYFIKAGTVHAIGGGIMICEIQQSSNCTYRLYDYDRVDKNGNKRELHIDKALDVLDYHKYEPQMFDDSEFKNENYHKRILASCKYFQCISYDINEKMQLQLSDSSFRSVICVNGNGTIRDGDDGIEFKMGDSLFLPKSNHTIDIEGNCELVITEL